MDPILCSAGPGHRGYPGIPTSWSQLMKTRAQEDLRLIATHLEDFEDVVADPDPGVDVEDFWEPAARSAAAIRAAHGLGTTVEFARPDAQWSLAMMDRRLGSVWQNEENRHGFDPLLLHPLLLEYGGRWLSLAGYTDEPGEFEPEHDAVELILSRARAGVKKVVLKLAASKTGMCTLDLTESMNAEDVHAQLFAGDVGWSLISLVGRRNSILLQDWIPLSYEYRLFVVDGKIISGAGCVEEFTPYNRISTDALFDYRVRGNRGNEITAGQPSEVIKDVALIEAYLETGSDIVAHYDGTVVFDLALVERDGEMDQIVLIEMNTLPNSGLYASNVDAVYEALSVAFDRGYGTYAWLDTAAEILLLTKD